MDLSHLGDTSSDCEGSNCSLAFKFSENCSNQDCYWEEPMFGLVELVCVTVVYISLMMFGLLGNILTILVVWLRPHMRSSTYLYLSSMAVSDLLILLLLPLDLYKLWRPRPWPLGDLACKLTMFLSECCTFCTILHITFLSLERYLAVCWPITAKTVVTRRRTRVIIGCLWLGAAVSAAPVLVMVGVEDVGGEELGLTQWREERGRTTREGEQGGLMIGGEERGAAHLALIDVELDEATLGEKETGRWGGEDREINFKAGEVNEWKQGGEGEPQDKKGAVDEANGEEWMEDQQNKKKEDEGGGKEGAEGSRDGETDRRECRCTHYAISSGLLSAMMVLSNLYFLVPLCILGLVYSLIGRTLWLRPKSSRRDQSHRNTVKMLGVIVLAFVLCWLPFHVGRTIFSLSLGSSADRQETSADPSSDFDTLTDANEDLSTHTDSEAFPQSDAHFFESLPQPGKLTADSLTETDERLCDVCARTKVKINARSNYLGTDEHIDSPFSTQTDLDHGNTDTSMQNPGNKTKTLIETHNDSSVVNSTGLYIHKPHEDLNSTYSHPDTHVYFLYYLSQYFNLVSSVLFYLSAAVNPLLYNLMSGRYRLAVRSLAQQRSRTHTHRLRTITARHSTTTL
ncbi:growth hormone secretagogue receptor type 1-like [Nematolebias whitei]|uniref:growth hormone secretagogue receptor type 1-like n=1 Tax=Nematolebias whitei TaxID=451745 RepID=UPI0018987FB5|nr:growth hormone secretagogue receptor type 1-like [Nematolebias whitei]